MSEIQAKEEKAKDLNPRQSQWHEAEAENTQWRH